MTDFHTTKADIASAIGHTPTDWEVFGTLLENHRERLNADADVRPTSSQWASGMVSRA